jgi:hypothetical protein
MIFHKESRNVNIALLIYIKFKLLTYIFWKEIPNQGPPCFFQRKHSNRKRVAIRCSSLLRIREKNPHKHGNGKRVAIRLSHMAT